MGMGSLVGSVEMDRKSDAQVRVCFSSENCLDQFMVGVRAAAEYVD